MRVNIVVAMAANRVIGLDGKLPWYLPADLRHFKQITTHHPLIMGRRTHESIGRALPQRRNIVISRREGCAAPGCETASSFEQALSIAAPAAEVMVIGGRAVYAEALAIASRMFMTEVHAQIAGDTYFPEYSAREWREVSREDHHLDEHNVHPYSFVVFDRVD